MKLSSRLSALARLIRAGKRMADIGTDHGYLPAYLLDQRICPFVYCCDVNPLPLKRAKQTFFALALTDGVSFVLSDGMTGLVSTDVEDVVIAGMGGDMIAHILEQGFSDGKVYEHIRFLLQPMSKAEKLRDYLGKNGFSRDEEVLVEDEGRVFLIFCCTYDGKERTISEEDVYFGAEHLQNPSSLAQKHRELCCHRLRKAKAGKEQAGKDASFETRMLSIVNDIKTRG